MSKIIDRAYCTLRLSSYLYIINHTETQGRNKVGATENNKTMATINLEGKDSKVVNFQEFEQILSSVSMNWHGIENWSRGDLDLFEDKFDGFTCEPFEGGLMKIWDLNFDYSPLYN